MKYGNRTRAAYSIVSKQSVSNSRTRRYVVLFGKLQASEVLVSLLKLAREDARGPAEEVVQCR